MAPRPPPVPRIVETRDKPEEQDQSGLIGEKITLFWSNKKVDALVWRKYLLDTDDNAGKWDLGPISAPILHDVPPPEEDISQKYPERIFSSFAPAAPLEIDKEAGTQTLPPGLHPEAMWHIANWLLAVCKSDVTEGKDLPKLYVRGDYFLSYWDFYRAFHALELQRYMNMFKDKLIRYVNFNALSGWELGEILRDFKDARDDEVVKAIVEATTKVLDDPETPEKWAWPVVDRLKKVSKYLMSEAVERYEASHERPPEEVKNRPQESWHGSTQVDPQEAQDIPQEEERAYWTPDKIQDWGANTDDNTQDDPSPAW
ncbi:hypothetical protein BT63DRAFT_462592 [Microthyrium microscopicum]|uniref:Uncharacterized protein n=1 Tax=Microthyrium microscopicum TaxID=703497 RepID=A0A6A6UTK3_9PEZI|nr:hypothetical protein BT63DRAFT_462592 [Microthyrium microscopicum]